MDQSPESLDQRLLEHQLIALDTSVLIYFLEGHPRFGGAAEEVLRAVQDGRVEALLSSMALMELLVRPLTERRPDIAEEHESALGRVSHLRIVPFNGRAHWHAASLRASFRLRPPEAALIGSALAEGATAYVTNDYRLCVVTELSVLILDDFAVERATK